MNKLIILFTLICTASGSIGRQKPADTIQNRKFNILFIGNSLTYINNLPELVEKSAKLKGITIETKMIANPDYALIDHWNDGKVQKLIASKKYNFVIVQQGPSSQTEGRNMLIIDGKKYSDLCKINGAQLCYFMVWPAMTNYDTFEAVIKNHTDVAVMHNAILLPVGEVWKNHFDSTNNFDYYSADGFHPSLKGSQVAADIIVTHLFQN
jgi:hypothetical protein